MLNRAALELRCAPVVLGHRLGNKRGPRLSSVVASRRESRPILSRTVSGSGDGRSFDVDGTMARASFDWLVSHERRGFEEERELCEANAAAATRPVRDFVEPAAGRHRCEWAR
jgi:hypothetical protein